MNKLAKKILLVDNMPANLEFLEAILRPEGYHTLRACNGKETLALAAQHDPDLILLDVIMPGMDGFQVARKLKSDPIMKKTPIIFVSSLSDRNSRLLGLNAGAEDFLSKPVDSDELKMRVKNILRVKEYSDVLSQHNLLLERRVLERTSELHTSHMETIFALTRAAEHRDDDTGSHVRRISHYCQHLAETIGMDSDFCDTIHYASPMHDIGKIGIPDQILLKPARHTSDEFEIMKSHCALGAEILLGFDSPYLKMGAEIAINHHERWDGTGYPAGLSGEKIPLSARIMAVCDVYDALRAKRPYKPAFSHEKAMGIIVEGDGRTLPKHFDPLVMDAFTQCDSRFQDIYQEHEYAMNIHAEPSPVQVEQAVLA
ncbi:MAG: response regulator [Gallionellaceae bacterium]